MVTGEVLLELVTWVLLWHSFSAVALVTFGLNHSLWWEQLSCSSQFPTHQL